MRAPTYRLTEEIVAAHAGGPVVCVAQMAMGRTYRLHPERPGASTNLRAHRLADGSVEWRADLPSGSSHLVKPVEPEEGPALIRVDIRGPIEQRAGYHDPCAGWSDGNDAIAERLEDAFAKGDVLLFVDSPGGANAGVQQSVERALAAKKKYGRRCTVFADEMIGSLAVWWSFAVGDELFIPRDGQVGSIGARGSHTSIAGALAQEGVAFTPFCWPNEGKMAWAPELPLSEEGRRRGERDVTLAGENFCATVCASAIGVRYGLTRDAIVALSADMLTGQAAVEAGLTDGIASLPEVTAYALAMVGRAGEENMDDDERAKAEGEEPGERAEGGDDPPPSSKPIPAADKMECEKCHAAVPSHNKYCGSCGAPMGEEGEEPGERAEGGDDPPPSSQKPGERRAELPTPARMTAPRRMSTSASLASILGATADTPLALKTAAIGLRHLKDTLTGVTGKDGVDEIVGAALALPAKLAAGQQARAELTATKKAAEDKERLALAHRLNKTGAVKRDKIFADIITPDGKRALDRSGQPKTRIRSAYATMPIATFRSLVEDLERDAPKQRRSPFEPDRARADAAAKGSTLKPAAFTPEQLKLLEQHPTVVQMQARGSVVTPPKLVAGFIDSYPDRARSWLAQIGASS